MLALVKQARGVLIFPNFISAGFIIGGASGQGVLREAGKTVSYHRMTEARSACWRARNRRRCSSCS